MDDQDVQSVITGSWGAQACDCFNLLTLARRPRCRCVHHWCSCAEDQKSRVLDWVDRLARVAGLTTDYEGSVSVSASDFAIGWS